MTSPESAVAAGLDAYLGAVLRPEPRAAERAVEELVSAGTPPRSIYLDVLQPALVRVGMLWQEGQITVAQERLATAITMGVMARLAPTFGRSPATGHRVILACSPGERHGIGIRMVGDFLEGDGWEVVELGAATPATDLVSIVRSTQPDVVGISTALTLHLADTKETIGALRAVEPRPFVIVGGAAYGGDARLAEQVGADLFASDAGEASRLLRERFGR